jgi:hypothetical protein
MTEPEQITRDRPACLTISGSGRSGTTIISVLLSQGPAVLNIGQLRDVLAAWAADHPCTCGETLSTCSLWGPLRQRLWPTASAADLAEADRALRRAMADAARLPDWNDSAALQALAATHRAAFDRLGDMLRGLVEISGARLLVDSSKSPEFALACHLSGAVDLHVLNLVRDPRAVACSWARKKPGRLGPRLAAWGQRQRRIARWKETAFVHHRMLSYEDFVASPQGALRSVLDWLARPMPPDLFTGPHSAQVSWADQHLFPPSNEKVLAERRTDVVVTAPTDWRAARNWPLHLRALLHSFPQGPARVLGLDRSDRRLRP